jgi:Flp pilus assembly protein TadG
MRRLFRDTRGTALIEFGYALPVLLALGMGGLEVAHLALAHLRVNQIAGMVADNSSRVITRIDEDDIEEVFASAEQVGAAIKFKENGSIVLSSLQANNKTGKDAGQYINWQRCWGDLKLKSAYGKEGTGKNNSELASGMGPKGKEIRSLPNTAVMFVEATYTYQPMFNMVLPPITIRREVAMNVRERTEQDISNSKGNNVYRCPV